MDTGKQVIEEAKPNKLPFNTRINVITHKQIAEIQEELSGTLAKVSKVGVVEKAIDDLHKAVCG